jgi:drug/metabolite transporter (DMT)-like permease
MARFDLEDRKSNPLLIGAAVVLLILIWGTTWAAIRIGLEGIPPFTGIALRFTIAAALLFLLSPVLKVRYWRTRSEPYLWVVNGVFGFAISYGVIYWGEQWVPSGLSAVLFATFPLFIAIFAHFSLPGEFLTVPGLVGVLIGFGGIAVIFSEDFALLGGPRVAFASAVMLSSPLLMAISNILVKRYGKEVHPVSVTVVPMAITAGVVGAFAWIAERGETLVFDATSVGALLYLAVFGSAVTFTLYYWLLREVAVTTLSLIAYAIPVVAVFVGAMFLDEPLTMRTLVGSALVVGGVALAGRARKRRRVPD